MVEMPLGSATARLPRPLSARLAALGSAALPERGRATLPPGCCLELSASKAADLTAYDHSGVRAPRDARTDDGLRKRSGHCRGPQGERCLSLTNPNPDHLTYPNAGPTPNPNPNPIVSLTLSLTLTLVLTVTQH